MREQSGRVHVPGDMDCDTAENELPDATMAIGSQDKEVGRFGGDT